ncbi:hypothetical protein C8Q75DRAFT_892284 [Abortiporus biennis]|nr:hypothetical protein C8Q75DRAFT_892284 [Abortiporus biennis]
MTLDELKIHSSHLLLPRIRPQKKPLSLSHLNFYSLNDASPARQWLSWTQTPNTLNSLSIHASDLMKMLPSFGRRLQLLKVRWDMDEDDLDENLSFGADVLPVLQTLCVTQIYDSSRTHAFCHVLSRSSLASSLSSIEIWSLPEEMKEQDSIVLDDTLAQLHDRVQIAIEKSRWKFFPKLESKGVLAILYNYDEDF